MTIPRTTAAARTHVGRVRTRNDDAYVERPEIGLWAVADGMGGYAHGRWSADAIVAALTNLAVDGDFDRDLQRLKDAIYATNAQIYARVLADGEKMGTTVAALLCQDSRFSVQWVGDSRVYLLRAGGLRQLTRDHTQVQELIDGGLLELDQAHDHPFGHVLARAVGETLSVEVDTSGGQVEAGDRFLICSDGLTRVVPDDEIRAIATVGDPASICDALVELCLQRGAPDNVTIIVVASDGP
jgi:serine/threonine protein phosphatase PrpC